MFFVLDLIEKKRLVYSYASVYNHDEISHQYMPNGEVFELLQDLRLF